MARECIKNKALLATKLHGFTDAIVLNDARTKLLQRVDCAALGKDGRSYIARLVVGMSKPCPRELQSAVVLSHDQGD